MKITDFNRILLKFSVIFLVAFTLAFQINVSSVSADITTGLQGYWNVDEGSGTTVGDSSGNGRTGTLTNGGAFTTGRINTGVLFDGTDDYISLPNFDISGSAITISAWIRADSFSSNIDTRFVSKATDTSEQGHYWMLGQTNSIGDKLRFRLKTDGNTTTLIASSGDFSTNIWTHIVATYDGSTMRLYKDGIEVGSVSKSGNLDTNSSVPVNLARSPDGSNYFDGTMDDIRIYNRALSASDITELYNYTGGGVTPPPTPTPTPPTTSTLTISKSGTGSGTVTGTGINCGFDCLETVNNGTAITLTASATSGSTFTGWSGGGCSGTGTCSVTVNSNTTVTATFNTTASTGPNIYVSQNGGGSTDGSSCTNAYALSWLNTQGNWGAGVSQVGSGKTIRFCGTITGQLQILGSGSAGNIITFTAESGSQFSKTHWTSPAIYANSNRSYLRFTGITITATASGTGLNPGGAHPILFDGVCDNCEFDNNSITNIYIRTAGSSDTQEMDGIHMNLSDLGSSMSNLLIHHNTFSHVNKGVFIAFVNGSNLQFNDNNCSHVASCIWIGDPSANKDINGVKIYNNTVDDLSNWGGCFNSGCPGDNWHHCDGLIHIFSNQPGSSINGLEIYKNVMTGPSCQSPVGYTTTAWIFVEDLGGDIPDAKIYNNLITAGQASDGQIYVKYINSPKIYNNTVVSSHSGSCMNSLGASNFEFKNNICIQNGGAALFDEGESSVAGISNNNLFGYGFTSWGAGTNGSTANPQLDAFYKLTTSSPGRDTGINISSLCPGCLTDILGIFRPQGSGWDIGAYEFIGSATPPPPPSTPTGTTFYIRDGGTSSSCTDWTNACDTLPATLQRGATYYIADGTYAGYTFDDPNSGTTLITIKKATAGDHGTNTGWSSIYGDGQAVFSGGLQFATDNWVIDGTKRNESVWNDGPSYGIKVASIGTNYFWYGHAADNVTIKYLDVGADYGNSDSDSYGEGIYLGGFNEAVENWLIQRSFIHNVSVLAQHAGVHNITYEYNFMGPSWSKSGIRHQLRGSSVTIRYNIFRNACQGHISDPSAGYSCTAIVGWYGNAGSNGEDYSNSQVYGNLFIDTVGGVFYANGVILMGDDRTSQGGGPSNCAGCKIFNNTFVGMGRTNTSSQVGFHFSGIKTNTEAANNIWYNVGSQTPFCQAVSCSNNPNITNANVFANTLGENFHLISNGSAGIGSTLSSLYNLDMEGNVRGADGVWDIGAYEFTGSGTTPPPAPTPIVGDINLDRVVNSLDWSLMNTAWFTTNIASDLNQDGQVNSLDFALLSSNWLRTW